MREVSKRRYFLYFLVAFAGTILLSPSIALSIECNECHGTKKPVDFRPLDDTYRNVTTGGFKGNHRTHTSRDNTKQQCEFCHSGSSSYNQGHRSGKIDISPNINNSRIRAIYDNRTSAWLQTATPLFGTCTNVNCHFENQTPKWGSSAFVAPGDCANCHGFPPYGGSTGAEGSHLAPGHVMGGDIDSCGHCHPKHNSFNHATSVRRPLLVIPNDPEYLKTGNYDGPTDDYLPGQDNKFGKCNNIYCHSNGSSVATGLISANNTPDWGGTPVNCGSCHSFPPDYPNGNPKANSHARHTEYAFTCNRCHYSTTSDNATIRNWRKHISKFYNISAQGEQLTYSFSANGGVCSNGYCHSNGTSTSTGTVQSNTVKWGSSSIACSSCHGYPPAYVTGAPKSNSHNIHSAYTCNNCHYLTTSDGTTIANKALHANNDYNVTPGTGINFTYSFSSAGGTCTNNSCHNDGTSISTGIVKSLPATWGGSLGCSGCHSFPPNYSNGAPKANSHSGKHEALYCDSCHIETTDGFIITDKSKHINNAYNVSNPRLFDSYTYNSAGGTCTNVQCHVNKQGYRQWGAYKCDACHGAPPNTPSHMKHFSGTALQASYTSVKMAQDYSPNSAGYVFNCGNCHPIDLNKHGNGTVEIELYNPNAPIGSIKSDLLKQGGAFYIKGNTPLKDERGFRYSNGTCGNVYCHSYMTWTTPEGVPRYNSYSSYVPANLVVETREYRTVTWNGPSLTCTRCHANPPQTTSPENDGGAGNSHSWIDSFGYDNLHTFNMGYGPISCTTCHNSTVKSFSAYTTIGDIDRMKDVPISNFSKHVNGKNDVDFDLERGYTYPPSYYGQVTFLPTSTTYNRSTKTCSNISCHFNESSVVWGTPYRWEYSTECNRCHRQ